MNVFQMLSAGGCHVSAYPIGEQYSFAKIAANAIGAEHRSLAYVSLRNYNALLKYLRENRRPEILVLQLGNYEAPWPIERHFREILELGPKNRNRAGASFFYGEVHPNPPPAEQCFEASVSWEWRTRMKRVYAVAAQLAHPPVYDEAAIQHKLRSLLGELKKHAIPQIVVLSPLPCADHMARYFRLVAAKVFREECARAGVIFLDTGRELGYTDPDSNRPFDIYVDDRHLNGRGHRVLAQSLIPLLRTNLWKNSPREEVIVTETVDATSSVETVLA